MKTRTKISLILLAITLSMSVSANTQEAESIFSKKVVHNLIQQSIDSSLDALLDELKILDAPVTLIAPIIRNTEADSELAEKNLNKAKRKAKEEQTS
ncbi:MAG: hypothetical protein ACI97K_001399 [Glaciecola sp.]|jgi:hypothetical protein